MSVPVQFGASDYGKTLTVLQDYGASSGEQITVAQGDKVRIYLVIVNLSSLIAKLLRNYRKLIQNPHVGYVSAFFVKMHENNI